MMIRAILTDLDGVWRIWPRKWVEEAQKVTNLPKGAIFKAAFSSDLLLPAITGEVSDDVWRTQIVTRLERHYPDADVHEAVRLWSEPAGTLNHRVMALMRRCRQHVPLILVTNATSRLPRDLKRLGIEDEFDVIINSSEIGVAKPDERFYEAALQPIGIPASNVLFIDDSAKNVAAAIEFGMMGHLFEGVEPLERLFAAHKLG